MTDAELSSEGLETRVARMPLTKFLPKELSVPLSPSTRMSAGFAPATGLQ